MIRLLSLLLVTGHFCFPSFGEDPKPEDKSQVDSTKKRSILVRPGLNSVLDKKIPKAPQHTGLQNDLDGGTPEPTLAKGSHSVLEGKLPTPQEAGRPLVPTPVTRDPQVDPERVLHAKILALMEPLKKPEATFSATELAEFVRSLKEIEIEIAAYKLKMRKSQALPPQVRLQQAQYDLAVQNAKGRMIKRRSLQIALKNKAEYDAYIRKIQQQAHRELPSEVLRSYNELLMLLGLDTK